MSHYNFDPVEKMELFRSPRLERWELVFYYKGGWIQHFRSFDKQLDALNFTFGLLQGPCSHATLIAHEYQAPIESEINDNSCRARQCKWNANDSCILAARDTRLPTPKVETSYVPWSEYYEVPRTCGKYNKT